MEHLSIYLLIFILAKLHFITYLAVSFSCLFGITDFEFNFSLPPFPVFCLCRFFPLQPSFMSLYIFLLYLSFCLLSLSLSLSRSVTLTVISPFFLSSDPLCPWSDLRGDVTGRAGIRIQQPGLGALQQLPAVLLQPGLQGFPPASGHPRPC